MIDVTELDIKEGVRKNYVHCMVSTAIGRLYPDATRIETVASTISFSRGQKRYTYVTPLEVRQYLLQFDEGEAIAPFRFELKEPQVTDRWLSRKNARRIVQRTGPKPKPTYHRSARVFGERAYGAASEHAAKAGLSA